jgi:COMPASS component SWD3
VVSGSEDGMVHIWDLESGQLMQRLPGHADVVYDAAWSEETSMLASCSHDGTLATWWYDPSKPLFAAEDPYMDAW